MLLKDYNCANIFGLFHYKTKMLLFEIFSANEKKAVDKSSE